MNGQPPMLLSQERARFALAKIRQVEEGDRQRARDYRSLIEGFPALVRSAGIGQALALVLKGDRAQPLLADHLRAWMAERGFEVGAQPIDFMARLATAERDEYLAIQQEALAICGWLKTFAQALLPAGN